jgi:hypothetical protein
MTYYPEEFLRSKIETATSCLAYPQVVPESASVPFVVYARVSTTRESLGVAGVTFPATGIFSVEIYADTYSQAKTIADQIRVALANFRDISTAATILSVLLSDERDGDPVFFNGQDKPTYMVEHSYQIRWAE